MTGGQLPRKVGQGKETLKQAGCLLVRMTKDSFRKRQGPRRNRAKEVLRDGVGPLRMSYQELLQDEGKGHLQDGLRA
ncbi:hypothetical protein C9I92_23785 [Photobacterium ganghwense]|uniref:Uncharacterized protein n=1 Tax=Photobacterium ganghwense TaxID=320778 RepID=A0A0J1HJI5_9GAMM|nr:hypothetical protein ABT57_00280 [Photobacterium ganghwense]PSU04590.1 hypothetical protein C9I92_23785 [Photobacterium ganghwense]